MKNKITAILKKFSWVDLILVTPAVIAFIFA